MNPYEVTVFSNQHVPVFTPQGRLQTIRRVGIRIGISGPYFKDFTPPADTASDIRNWIDQMVQDEKRIQGV